MALTTSSWTFGLGIKHALTGLAALALFASLALCRAEAAKAVQETGLVYASENALFIETQAGEVYRLSGEDMTSYLDTVVTVLGDKRLSEDGYMVFNVSRVVSAKRGGGAVEGPAPTQPKQ